MTNASALTTGIPQSLVSDGFTLLVQVQPQRSYPHTNTYSISPSLYVAYRTLKAFDVCPSFGKGDFTRGRAFNTTIAYPSSILPSAVCDVKRVSYQGSPAENVTDLQHSTIYNRTCLGLDVTKNATNGPYLSVPQDIISLDPAWSTCTAVLWGASDSPIAPQGGKLPFGHVPYRLGPIALTKQKALVPPPGKISPPTPAPASPVAPPHAPATPTASPMDPGKLSTPPPHAKTGPEGPEQQHPHIADPVKSSANNPMPNPQGHDEQTPNPPNTVQPPTHEKTGAAAVPVALPVPVGGSNEAQDYPKIVSNPPSNHPQPVGEINQGAGFGDGHDTGPDLKPAGTLDQSPEDNSQSTSEIKQKVGSENPAESLNQSPADTVQSAGDISQNAGSEHGHNVNPNLNPAGTLHQSPTDNAQSTSDISQSAGSENPIESLDQSPKDDGQSTSEIDQDFGSEKPAETPDQSPTVNTQSKGDVVQNADSEDGHDAGSDLVPAEALDQSSADNAQSLPSIGGHPLQAASGGGIVIASTTLQPGVQTTIDSTPVSVGENQIVVASSIIPLARPSANPIFTLVNGDIISAGGKAAIVGGTTVALAPNGFALVVNGKTSPLPPPPTPILTVAGQTITAAPTGFAVGGQNVSPGGSVVTYAGSVFSLASDSDALVVNGKTLLFSPPPTPVLTVAGQIITANPTGFVIGGQSILPGESPITYAESVFSLAPDGNALVVNGNTTPLPSPSVSVFKIGSQTITVAPTGFTIGDQSILPGGPAMTYAGSVLSLASGGNALVVNGRTTPLPSPSVSVFKIGSQTITVAPTGFTIGDQSILPGGPAMTYAGSVFSLASGGSALIVNDRTTPLPSLPPFSVFNTGPDIFPAALTGLFAAGTQSFSQDTLVASADDGMLISLAPSESVMDASTVPSGSAARMTQAAASAASGSLIGGGPGPIGSASNRSTGLPFYTGGGGQVQVGVGTVLFALIVSVAVGVVGSRWS